MVIKKIVKAILFTLGILSIASFGDTLRSVVPFLEKATKLFDNYIKPIIIQTSEFINISEGYVYCVFTGIFMLTIFIVPIVLYFTPKATKELDKWQPRFMSIVMLLSITIIPLALSFWPLIIIGRILIHLEHYYKEESHQKKAIESTTNLIALIGFIIAAIVEFLF